MNMFFFEIVEPESSSEVLGASASSLSTAVLASPLGAYVIFLMGSFGVVGVLK